MDYNSKLVKISSRAIFPLPFELSDAIVILLLSKCRVSMNKSIIIILSLLFAFVAVGVQAEDRIVAKYNGKDCTKSEIEAWIKITNDGKLPDNKKDFDELDKNLKTQIINEYIRDKILLEAAEKSNDTTSIDYKKKLEALTNGAKVAIYFNKYLKDKMSSSMVREEYAAYVKDLKAHDDLKLRQILIKSQEEANKVFEDITNKKITFEDAVKKYSQDENSKSRNGDIGFLSYNRIPPELYQFQVVGYSLKKDEVSKPFQTPFGWHIIKLVDTRKAVIPTFEQVKDDFEAEVASRIKKTHVAELFNASNVEVFVDKSNSPKK